jgi:lysophospholipase L1-like esterase
VFSNRWPALLRAGPAGRRSALALALAALITGCSGGGSPAPRPTTPPASYYLALGDSLALGVQPDSTGTSLRTGQGYADQLSAGWRRRLPGLRLVKLGCLGETTATMIHGGICHYRDGSQLATAAAFLRSHRSHIALVTLDIGANDPEKCLAPPSPLHLVGCMAGVEPRATGNLRTILATLHRADAKVRIVGMNYYLPALAQWRHGFAGELIARLSQGAAGTYNSALTGVYRSAGVPVADVYDAFHTASFSPDVTVPGLGSLPRNVAAVCQWTWECAPPPRGPNQHPNRAGYQVIARAFLAAGARPAVPG